MTVTVRSPGESRWSIQRASLRSTPAVNRTYSQVRSGRVRAAECYESGAPGIEALPAAKHAPFGVTAEADFSKPQAGATDGSHPRARPGAFIDAAGVPANE